MKKQKLHRNAGRRKPTRDERRALEKEYGVTSGRQWVKLRKGLQRAVRAAQREAASRPRGKRRG